ncbi:MAG: hypothetical protein HY565_02605 [Candidatus Kerfeldbacteria bacterium]|nr:hypothetical protein [Candidatus Kerfeldbacteria bacterium]
MSEKDFITRRRKQLAGEGRLDLAEQLDHPPANEPAQAPPLTGLDEVLRRVPAEQMDEVTEFISTYSEILELLTALRHTGYVPSPETLAAHQRQVSGWSDHDLYESVIEADRAHIQQEPAFYTALIEIIQRRGHGRIILAGINYSKKS